MKFTTKFKVKVAIEAIKKRQSTTGDGTKIQCHCAANKYLETRVLERSLVRIFCKRKVSQNNSRGRERPVA